MTWAGPPAASGPYVPELLCAVCLPAGRRMYPAARPRGRGPTTHGAVVIAAPDLDPHGEEYRSSLRLVFAVGGVLLVFAAVTAAALCFLT
ncbi:hypothetical protein [Streptomyces carpaticus]|uniref:hypothetical protein n=1 Tax=Streptomyces carpaticus TaxID=285558 RepID=UPI0031F72A63